MEEEEEDQRIGSWQDMAGIAAAFSYFFFRSSIAFCVCALPPLRNHAIFKGLAAKVQVLFFSVVSPSPAREKKEEDALCVWHLC